MPDRDPSAPHRGRILVADDEPHIRRILVTFLEASGFSVDQVSDGAGALELLRGPTPYDMALLDIMMPEQTGLRSWSPLGSCPTVRRCPW